MSAPTQYKWLNKIGQLPRTIELALQFHGLQEVVGKGDNKTIMAWADELNRNGVKIEGYSSDEVPWCGLFAAFITYLRKGSSNEVVAEPLWARNWSDYGVPIARRVGNALVNIRGFKPSLGDIMVFERGNGGHVAFYIGEDSDCYHVLGGNQSNRVTITRILKSRCLSVRRPPYVNQPDSVKPYILQKFGSISQNEQ